MPPLYIAIHLLLTGLCFYLALRVPLKWSLPLRLFALGVVIAGYAVERWPDLAWSSMALGFRDLVFFSNISLEGVTVILVLMWRGLQSRSWPVYVRATALSVLLLGGVLWSYSWFFVPLPTVNGHIRADGFLRQTTEDSCAAAAAVMLLHANGITANEKEMVDLCLTRAGVGTRPAGLFRGLAIKGISKNLRPELIRLQPGEFHQLRKPAIIAVGLLPGTPEPIAAELASKGWHPGFRHAVAILGAAEDGSWLDVADPNFGRERWPIQDMKYLWDDRALVMSGI